MRRRAIILVLDGVGVGAAADAAQYGDVGSDTLGNLARARNGLDLPNLGEAGLGNIAAIHPNFRLQGENNNDMLSDRGINHNNT